MPEVTPNHFRKSLALTTEALKCFHGKERWPSVFVSLNVHKRMSNLMSAGLAAWLNISAQTQTTEEQNPVYFSVYTTVSSLSLRTYQFRWGKQYLWRNSREACNPSRPSDQLFSVFFCLTTHKRQYSPNTTCSMDDSRFWWNQEIEQSYCNKTEHYNNNSLSRLLYECCTKWNVVLCPFHREGNWSSEGPSNNYRDQ